MSSLTDYTKEKVIWHLHANRKVKAHNIDKNIFMQNLKTMYIVQPHVTCTNKAKTKLIIIKIRHRTNTAHIKDIAQSIKCQWALLKSSFAKDTQAKN